ncbi:hypothetical protein MYX65_10315, partial [Acidobacteria bacterium AH-259-L09]|nr:hypothetical protein [Acidobacteria bacterium AH-259-L09]
MAQHHQTQDTFTSTSPFRIDVELHELLVEPRTRLTVEPAAADQRLPDPIFPQCPNGDGEELSESKYQNLNAIRTALTLAVPYVKSRWHRSELRPIIPYLFTDYKCNLDCHYCWSFNNKVKGMTEDTARRSI